MKARLLITRGLASLARSEALAQPLGPYTLQAAIAACHARARTPDTTDWPRIVALYYDAAAQTSNSRERAALLARAASCANQSSGRTH